MPGSPALDSLVARITVRCRSRAGIGSELADGCLFPQPPKKDKDDGGKSKKADSGGGGGKAKKKKWSKGKQKEKLNAAVFFDKNLYEKLKKEVPNYKLITCSIISERMRCNVSMARRAINDLLAKGMIKVIAKHQKQAIYTRALAGAE
jgi:small subunit ribosomal protein S25e